MSLAYRYLRSDLQALHAVGRTAVMLPTLILPGDLDELRREIDPELQSIASMAGENQRESLWRDLSDTERLDCLATELLRKDREWRRKEPSYQAAMKNSRRNRFFPRSKRTTAARRSPSVSARVEPMEPSMSDLLTPWFLSPWMYRERVSKEVSIEVVPIDVLNSHQQRVLSNAQERARREWYTEACRRGRDLTLRNWGQPIFYNDYGRASSSLVSDESK
jgi:hypothetical protein